MSEKDNVMTAYDKITATIASGTSLTNAQYLGGLRLFGIVMPAAWTAAAVTFQASFDGGATYNPIKNTSDGSDVSFVVNASGYFPLPDVSQFSAVSMLKIQSGTSAAPVAQGAARTIGLVLRNI